MTSCSGRLPRLRRRRAQSGGGWINTSVAVQAGGQAVRKQLGQLEGRQRTLTALLVQTFGTLPSWTLIIYCMYVVWWLKTPKSPKYVCDQTIGSDVTRGRVFNFQGLTICIFQMSISSDPTNILTCN